jgi:hypothetical protein
VEYTDKMPDEPGYYWVEDMGEIRPAAFKNGYWLVIGSLNGFRHDDFIEFGFRIGPKCEPPE